MPKQKTNRGAAKRFKQRGSGSIKCSAAYHNHMLTKKAKKRKRRLRAIKTVHPSDVKAVAAMLRVNIN